jgi:hypothetical protein
MESMMNRFDTSHGPGWEAMLKEDLSRHPENRKLYEQWEKRIKAACAEDEQFQNAMKLAIERSRFVPKASDVKTDVAPKLKLRKGKLDGRTKWITKWAQKRVDQFQIPDPMREQAIANVRERQERELQQFRESIDQDELEVIEFERLATIEGARVYEQTQTRRTRR